MNSLKLAGAKMSLSIKTTCRACLAESLENFSEMDKPCSFSPGDLTFCEIFNLCTHLLINTHDGLPQRICKACVSDLQIAYVFLQKVLKSDGELNKLGIIHPHHGDGNGCKSGGQPVKDPLEHVTDSEEKESGLNCLHENVDDDQNSLKGIPEYVGNLDNDDNRFEDFARLGPHVSSSLSDSDKDDSDFLVSVESQIFPQGRFKCKLCEKTYFTNMGLQAHMEIHTPNSKAPSKESTNSSLKNKRRKKQNKIGPEVSEEGDDETTNPQEVIKRRKDSQPKPKKMFPCQVCGKQMISASKLRYHMVMHTGEKDYLCTMCPKAYSTIYALKHHMRAHTNERPYECKFCGDCFLRPTTLKSHTRRHTGERPYGCEICGKRFIQHSSMATHMKLNHMDKTISCPYCDKKYARQTDLNTHLLSHSGDKPFACKLCPSRFTRQSNLNKHMNQQHHQSGEASSTEKGKPSQIQNKKSNSNEYTKNKKSSSEKTTITSLPLSGGTSQKLTLSNSTSTSTEMLSTHSDSDFDKLISPNTWSWPNQT